MEPFELQLAPAHPGVRRLVPHSSTGKGLWCTGDAVCKNPLQITAWGCHTYHAMETNRFSTRLQNFRASCCHLKEKLILEWHSTILRSVLPVSRGPTDGIRTSSQCCCLVTGRVQQEISPTLSVTLASDTSPETGCAQQQGRVLPPRVLQWRLTVSCARLDNSPCSAPRSTAGQASIQPAVKRNRAADGVSHTSGRSILRRHRTAQALQLLSSCRQCWWVCPLLQ